MNLREIEPPALHKLEGYLEAVSDFIRTGELKWYFDVRLFEIEGAVSDVKQLIKVAYPDCKPDKAEIGEGTIRDLLDTLRYELGRSLPEMESLRILTPVVEPHLGMWQYLGECIGYEQERFFEYITKESLDGFGTGGIIGNFAFVILDESQQRCMMFSGGDCD
ncbi:MAG TPA: hypothetical protein VIQ24_11910 [Pyrinomonadaceae bacterium]